MGFSKSEEPALEEKTGIYGHRFMWMCIYSGGNLQKLFLDFFNFLSKVEARLPVESNKGGENAGGFSNM